MLSAAAQIFVFLTGGGLVAVFVFGIVAPFVDANPQVIIPGIIGGVVGMFCSVPVVATLDSDLVWDFFIKLGTPPCIGIALGFTVGLLL